MARESMMQDMREAIVEHHVYYRKLNIDVGVVGVKGN
jgi:hypothetical protein